MKEAIWKFPLLGNQEIEMPKGAKVLCVQLQGAQPCLWAICPLEGPGVGPVENEIRTFVIYGTGHEHEDISRLTYIGTYQLPGPFVYHVFEKGE